MGGVHHHRRDRGVTLIELLITIIVAGLFFAAMVPVFVMATQQSSNDRARIQATNAVQSAIERLREMPYEDLWTTDWSIAVDTQAALGQDLNWKGSNSSLDVDIEPYPSDVSKGSEKYLIATVTADWTGQGGRPHTIRMKTVIYRQGLATETLTLVVYELSNGFISHTPVTVSARVNAADGAKLERIDFTVYANNGTLIEAWKVYTQAGAEVAYKPDGSPTWYYDHEWTGLDGDGQPLADGRYTFIAKTVPLQPASPDDPVLPAEWARKELILDRDPPGTPTVESSAGFHKATPTSAPQPFVNLKWQLEPNISDLDHFEIGRTGTDAKGDPLQAKIIALPKWALEYVDRDVVAGATYSYKVRAWDIQDQFGAWSSPTPDLTLAAAVTDLVPLPPVGPISYRLTNPGVTVEWGASPSALNVDAYRVYRQGTDGVRLLVGTLPVGVASPDLRFSMDDISAEYGKTYTYFVTAVSLDRDAFQWESASTSGAPLHVPEPPKVGMKVDVLVEAGVVPPLSATLMIHSLDNGDIIPANPWDYPTIDLSNRNHDTWITGNILYPGTYEVIAVFYGKNHVMLGTSTSEAILLSSPDTPVHIPYPGQG